MTLIIALLFKVPISMKEARLPMGLRKDLHIKAITEIPEVRDRWQAVYGKYPDQGNDLGFATCFCLLLFEPRHEKTVFVLQMQKQRRRSASR